MSKKRKTTKRSVTVFLSEEDYQKLTAICESRRQSRADFLRAAITVHEQVPYLNTRPLVGACLQRHLARLAREKKKQTHNPTGKEVKKNAQEN